MTRDEVERTDN